MASKATSAKKTASATTEIVLGAAAKSLSKVVGEVEFLEKQSVKWEQALAEERKAGVERAKASAVGNISIGGDGAYNRK